MTNRRPEPPVVVESVTPLGAAVAPAFAEWAGEAEQMGERPGIYAAFVGGFTARDGEIAAADALADAVLMFLGTSCLRVGHIEQMRAARTAYRAARTTPAAAAPGGSMDGEVG